MEARKRTRPRSAKSEVWPMVRQMMAGVKAKAEPVNADWAESRGAPEDAHGSEQAGEKQQGPEIAAKRKRRKPSG